MLAGGVSNRAVAKQFGLSEASVRRHIDAHVSAMLATARREQEVEGLQFVGDLQDQVRAIRDRASSLLRKAETAGDIKTALQACRELSRTIELLAKLTGDVSEDGSVAAPVIVFYRADEPPASEWIDQQVPGHSGNVLSLPAKRTVLMIPENGRDLQSDG
jgi:hypothetical protein